MKAPPVLHRAIARSLIFFLLLLSVSLKADDETPASPPPTADQLKAIQEKSLELLRDLAPSSSSGRKLESMSINDGVVYWGDLFDPNEVVALVNLPPEKPDDENDGEAQIEHEWWPRQLSLCAWEKDHWVYRQYVDNANTLVFHDRQDSPHHFVQASRRTGRYEGDYLSWYYDPKTKTLVRTHYETWGPFYLVGNYLCTTNGFQRRSMSDTASIYRYKEGRKGDLLARYDSDTSRELPSFSITFRERRTGKFWTYSFHKETDESPYTVDAVEGDPDAKFQNPDTRLHYSAKIKTKGGDEPFDSYCFERLTGLNPIFRPGDPDDDPYHDWNDVLPPTPPIKEIRLEITGDPEIVRHLKNP